jgi:subtilisin family serine protease
MSFGGTNDDHALSDAIDNALANDVVVVAAAGNSGTDNDVTTALYPCNYTQQNLICVAALDQNYSLASFSNYGTTSVDVGAPGVNIKSTWPGETLVDDMTGWTETPIGGWSEIVCSLSSGGTINLIADPSSYCAGGGYGTNLTDVSYKTFDLSSYADAGLSFLIFYQVEQDNDIITLNTKGTGGNPFSGGTQLSTFTGDSLSGGSGAQNVSVDIPADCFTTTCSIGFQLNSNGTTTANERGVAVGELTITALQTNSNTYDILSGTSMATPHVSGIVAMVRAFNPDYTYLDAVNAVKNSGDSIPALTDKTTSGRAVDAYKAIQYINAPRGVSAVVN